MRKTTDAGVWVGGKTEDRRRASVDLVNRPERRTNRAEEPDKTVKDTIRYCTTVYDRNGNEMK